jgi:hypothetical protein
MQELITSIFNMRLEYKAQKNPMQARYKLIMNSAYGKSIQKPIESDYKFKRENKDYDNFIYRHYHSIIEDVTIQDSTIHSIKEVKPIDKYFNFTLLGIQILSMSKRIMTEVMCLAYDIGCRIYSQDTESMHIETADVPRLKEAFIGTYHRDLVGTSLGQFHDDFEPINGEIPISRHDIFVGKKFYLDELINSKVDINYHPR